MKVAFFGTSDRSIPLLESLNSNFDLKFTVTKNDRIVGRKLDVEPTRVKTWSMQNRIQYITTDSLKTEDKEIIIQALLSTKVDICVVADFSFMIPDEILSTPPLGFVNIHFSLLPKYRGASPVQFAILNGDEETGITYHMTEKGMDTGPILKQTKYKLAGKETSGELYDKLFHVAANELPDVLRKYKNGQIIPRKQNNADASLTLSKTHQGKTFVFKEDAKIDWDEPAEQIDRMVRAFNPWPIAWTTLGELEKADQKFAEGSIELKDRNKKDKTLKIYETEVSNVKLLPKKVQVEGSKIVSWNDFKNGYLITN